MSYCFALPETVRRSAHGSRRGKNAVRQQARDRCVPFCARPGNSAAASPRKRPPKLGVLACLLGTPSALQAASPRRTPISESLSRDSYGTTSIYLLTADMGSNEIKSLAPYRTSTISHRIRSFVPDSNRRPVCLQGKCSTTEPTKQRGAIFMSGPTTVGISGVEPPAFALLGQRSTN